MGVNAAGIRRKGHDLIWGGLAGEPMSKGKQLLQLKQSGMPHSYITKTAKTLWIGGDKANAFVI